MIKRTKEAYFQAIHMHPDELHVFHSAPDSFEMRLSFSLV